MSRPPREEWTVPVTIAEERRVTVLARSEADAKERTHDGRIKRLGPVLTRGIIIVGKPERGTR
jgi:hypothetical protein